MWLIQLANKFGQVQVFMKHPWQTVRRGLIVARAEAAAWSEFPSAWKGTSLVLCALEAAVLIVTCPRLSQQGLLASKGCRGKGGEFCSVTHGGWTHAGERVLETGSQAEVQFSAQPSELGKQANLFILSFPICKMGMRCQLLKGCLSV